MELQRRREATGMSREEVARQLKWSTSNLFRIETGQSRPQPGNVRILLELYGVTGTERDGLIQQTREARQPGWWHSFRDVLPNPYEVYIGLEAGAASIRNFEPVVVPGLLQTADYARKIFRNGPIELDPDEVERLLEARLARQKILAREDRPRLSAVIDEAVIHRVVGGPDVMREQLRHLIESAQEGKTTIQVVPYRAGWGARSPARPERVAADETQQSGLGIRTAGHLDPGAVLAGGAENLLHLLHPAEELSAEAGVQPVVLAGSPGQVPRVHEHVSGVEPVDRGLQGQAADVRVGEFPVRRLRIVQHRLHAVAVNLPRGDRVLVHRRPAGQFDAGAGGKEPGEPFGQVANYVAGGPAGDRGWRVPGPGTADPFGKEPGHLPVPLGRAVR